MPPFVGVAVEFVPPFAIGKTPVTSDVSETVPPPDNTPDVDLTKPFDKPENVIVPLEVRPVAAATAPDELTWNCELDPTEKRLVGVEFPTPTFPPFGFKAKDRFKLVEIIPSPVKLKALPAELPEIEAVGELAPVTFKKANLAEVEDCPPTKRSSVEFKGTIAPFKTVNGLCTLEPVAHEVQEGALAPLETKHWPDDPAADVPRVPDPFV